MGPLDRVSSLGLQGWQSSLVRASGWSPFLDEVFDLLSQSGAFFGGVPRTPVLTVIFRPFSGQLDTLRAVT